MDSDHSFGVSGNKLRQHKWWLVDAGILLCVFTAFFLVAFYEGVLVNTGGIHVMAMICGPLVAGLCGRYVGLRRRELPGA